MPRQKWIIDTSDVQSGGFIASRRANQRASDPRFLRDAHEPRTIYLVEEVGLDGELYREIDLSTYEKLVVGVGPVDAAPTGGTFGLTVDADGTGLSALGYSISEADMQTAFDTNPAVTTKGGVTVTKTGSGFFRIVLNDANKSLTILADSDGLQPPSTIDIRNPVPAAADKQAVYIIRLLQRTYGYSDDWTLQNPNATVGTFTAVAATDLVTCAAHGRSAGNRVRLTSDDTLPAPFVEGKDYYVLAAGLTADELKLSEWADGDPINITSAGTGTHTMVRRDYGVRLTTLSDGSEGGPASYQVEIDPEPLSGSVRFSVAQKQQHAVACTPNTGTATVWYFVGLSGSYLGLGVDFDGTYFDVRGASDEIVRIWFHETIAGTSAAPSVPAGGRTVQANFAAAYPFGRDQMYSAVVDALAGDVALAAEYDDTFLIITSLTTGKKSSASGGTASWMSSLRTTKGKNGRLEGQGFLLNDRFGTVCVHVPNDDGSSGTLASVADGRRLIAVTTLSSGDTAAQVATKIAAVLAADPEFENSTADGPFVYAIDTYGGTRGTETTASSGYFSVTIDQPGFSLYSSFRCDATAQEVEGETIGDQFSVTKPKDFQWIFTRDTDGPTTTPQVEDLGLVFPIGLEGTIDFDTDSLHEAFAATTSETISSKLEITLKLTGEEPRVVLKTDCTLERNLLSAESMRSPAFDTTLTESNGIKFISLLGLTGGDGYLDGIATTALSVGRAVGFVYEDGLAVFELVAGTDAEASPEVIQPDDFNAISNAKVWKRRL